MALRHDLRDMANHPENWEIIAAIALLLYREGHKDAGIVIGWYLDEIALRRAKKKITAKEKRSFGNQVTTEIVPILRQIGGKQFYRLDRLDDKTLLLDQRC